jgi:hypothetical protein
MSRQLGGPTANAGEPQQGLRPQWGPPTLDGMSTPALLAFALVLPTLAGFTIVVSVHGYHRIAEARLRPPPAEPVDRIAERLRRLRAELEATECGQRGTAKRHHVLAARGAYIDTLSYACERLGISPPAGGDRARQAEIYRVEAALREHGLDVREAAAP